MELLIRKDRVFTSFTTEERTRFFLNLPRKSEMVSETCILKIFNLCMAIRFTPPEKIICLREILEEILSVPAAPALKTTEDIEKLANSVVTKDEEERRKCGLENRIHKTSGVILLLPTYNITAVLIE